MTEFEKKKNKKIAEQLRKQEEEELKLATHKPTLVSKSDTHHDTFFNRLDKIVEDRTKRLIKNEEDRKNDEDKQISNIQKRLDDK